MGEHVQAHQVGGAEGGAARKAQRRPGQLVHLLDAQALLLHQPQDVQHREGADAVGDEIRSVLRPHDHLAQAAVGELGDGCEHFRPGVAGGDHFQQAHVAGRVEEVGAQPVAAEVFRAPFGDLAEEEAAGVRGDDGARAADGFHALEQRPLDVQALGHRFDDPVGFAQPLQVVLEVAQANPLGVVGQEERLGVGLLGGFQPRSDDAVADGGVVERQPALLFLFSQLAGDDIQQNRLKSGVRQVGGDARPHHPGTQNGKVLQARHRNENLPQGP